MRFVLLRWFFDVLLCLLVALRLGLLCCWFYVFGYFSDCVACFLDLLLWLFFLVKFLFS